MKTFLSIYLIVFLGMAKALADNEQKLKIPVESVVVYLDGAEITQSKSITLEAGRNTLVFTGISSYLISKSIQVNAGANASILSISDKINYLGENALSPKLRQLQDSLKLLNSLQAQLAYEKEAYDTEKKMLLENKALNGTEKAVSIAELKLAADFYRSRIKEINVELFKLDKKTELNTEIIQKLQNEIYEQNGSTPAETAEITVLLASEAKSTIKIELKYLVTNTGWAPNYDLTAEDINKPIELRYRAKVYNNTGVDWNNVKMKLSTSNPSLNASKPQLAAWFLNFENNDYLYKAGIPAQYQQQDANYLLNNANSVFPAAEQNNLNTRGARSCNGNEGDAVKQVAKGAAKVIYNEVQVSELSAEFEIKNTYTIPADAKPYIVEVTTYNLPATFRHYSIPKTEKEAFLLARITGWEQLDLVEGPANIYFGGSYVGQSYIYTRSLDDTLDISLGRDKKVQVSRSRMKDFNSKTFSGSNKKETQSFEIIVKNNRKSPITIDVEDQLPVSQNSEIVVEAEELSKAKKEDATGKLTWTYTIAPGEQQKITLTYSIKYPKNKVVRAKKFRSVSAPSF